MGTSLPSSVFWFVVGFVLSSALLLAVVVAGVLGLVGAGCSEVGGAVAEGVLSERSLPNRYAAVMPLTLSFWSYDSMTDVLVYGLALVKVGCAG